MQLVSGLQDSAGFWLDHRYAKPEIILTADQRLRKSAHISANSARWQAEKTRIKCDVQRCFGGRFIASIHIGI